MTFWRYVVLWLVAACGSQHVTTRVEPPTKTQPTVAEPVAAAPIAVAFVIEGSEMWIGNDGLPDVPEQERYPGALEPFKVAFARMPLTDLPAGSTAAVVTYADHASVRHPMAPIEKLSARAFGDQKDYAGVIDRNLVAGVTLGLDELVKVSGARRVLVVIGDGTDSQPDAATAALTALAGRAVRENVEIVSIIYKGILSSPSNPIMTFDPTALHANAIDAIVNQLGWAFARLNPRPVVARAAGSSPLALVLLVSGTEVWIGNDDLVPADAPDKYTGGLKAIRAALDRSAMTGFPEGSQGMVLRYDSSVQPRLRMGPIEKLDAHAVGDQKAYYGAVGTELVSGVYAAFTELANVDAARRVLVVVGDGSDTDNEAAKLRLRDLAKRAAELHIEVYAIVYKGQLSEPGTVITELDPRASFVTSTDAITIELTALFRVLRKQAR